MNEEALKARLKLVAHDKKMTFNQIWKQLLLERFLARLSSSNHQEKFIFKGGLLLATYINIGRETSDIDFLLRNLHAEEENIKIVMSEIIDGLVDEDVNFQWYKIEKLTQPHMPYNGFRISLHANFGKMKDIVQIDIGIGDVVIPEEKQFFPFMYKGTPIFVGEITLLVYPIESIFSEKLESVISRGALNSRMKDYHDLLLMARESTAILNEEKLISSIKNTFTQRLTNVDLPISFDASGLETLQKLWTNHLRGLGPFKERLQLPDTISEVIEEINDKFGYFGTI